VRELPQGWACFPLRELGDITGGLTKGKKRRPTDRLTEVPYLRVANVQRGFLNLSEMKLIEATDSEIAALSLVPGDVLFNEGGDRDKLGRGCVWSGELPLCIHQNHVFRVRLKHGLIASYVSAYGNSDDGQRYFLGSGKQTTNLASINITTLGGLPVRVPPIEEQLRIVAKLDALQSSSRRARGALDSIPPLLEKLRQSILAAAFRGDLTKDWRGAHPDAQPIHLRDNEASVPRKHLWGSGRTADAVDASWGVLPTTWQWARVRDLNEQPGIAVQIGPMSMKSSDFVDEGVTVLNVGCVQRGRIDLTKADHLPSSRARDFDRYTLMVGDVLFTRSGTVGRCACLADGLSGALMTFHLLRVRPSASRCVSEYLMYAFQGCRAISAQIDASSVGATRAGFNTRLLEEMWIPLAPPAEQRELLRRVSQQLGQLDAIHGAIARLQHELSEMDRSTLAKAFCGELVPQDPADEPVLLSSGCGGDSSFTPNSAPPISRAVAKRRRKRTS